MTPIRRDRRIGLWLIGASGNVAATVAIGLSALRRKLIRPVGLLTEELPVSSLPLAALSRIVVGGHEIDRRQVRQTIAELHERSGLFSERVIRATAADVRAVERNTRRGIALRENAALAVARVRRDLREFARRNRLERVAVINVASTEPPLRITPVHQSWDRLATALKANRAALPASSLYAIAAIEERMPYVNFTPSAGADVPAIRERAAALGACIMGADGKTGETLLKSVLAPMFRDRGLRVLSWAGHNILGNRDGQVLNSPAAKASKLRTKDGIVKSVLGPGTQTHTAIEFIESLDDWKTAWDHIHFEGFLGTRMAMQFIWQGCDSALAAPLVIDLARLAEYHAATGGTGVMTHLACYFKAPMDVREHQFSRQIDALRRYALDRTRAR
ncbi:MAG: inositol-3-phosphate synthase [Planctomycetes bacterium]|nr:inositol-3-phosphate synthase [Planctomycetota bacterium]